MSSCLQDGPLEFVQERILLKLVPSFTPFVCLGARHESARRRRDEILKERSLSLAIRTGYPVNFHATPRMARPATTALLVDPAIIEPKRFTDEDIVEAQARCQDRVKVAHTKEAIARRHDREVELDRLSRTKNVSFEASAVAARRLRDRKVHERKLQEEEVDLLMSQQTSSIEAMNIARMLSPRYEEKVAFQPSVSRNSVEEARVKQLLMNARVGSFYQ